MWNTSFTFTLAADPHTAIPLSIYKPILYVLTVAGWAWLMSYLDKDATFFLPHAKFKRRFWNGIHFGVGVFALLLWLIIPQFWVGLPLTIFFVAASLLGYGYYRNQNVQNEDDKWTFSMESFKNRISSTESAQAQKRANILITTKEGQPLEVPSGDDPRVGAHRKFEDLVEFLLPRGGDRIDMAVNAQNAAVIAKIDGVRYPLSDVEAPIAVSMIDYLKAAANMDMAERRKKQTGELHFKSYELGNHCIGMTTYGSTRELVLTMSVDPLERSLLGIDQIGLLDAQLEQLQPLVAEHKYVVIAASPPEHGQTTTLYNLVQKHDPYVNSVVTLEDKIPFELEGVSHNPIDASTAPGDITKRVAAMLRAEPQVMFLSHIHDGQLAQLIADSSQEARFYIGMRAEDTFSALRAWIKATGDPRTAGENLGAVVAQRLVRRLCTTCRVPFAPDPAALRKLNLAPDKVGTLFKHSGQVLVKNRPEPCPACSGLGYRGQIGVFEVMVLDDEARNILAEGNLEQLRAHLRKNKMLWLQEAALAKVVDGITSIQEITRALGKDADKPMPLPQHTRQQMAGKGK